jgi:hypothetical protein
MGNANGGTNENKDSSSLLKALHLSRQTGCPIGMVRGGGWNRGGGRGWKMNPGVFVLSITDAGHLLAARGAGYQGPLLWRLCIHPR